MGEHLLAGALLVGSSARVYLGRARLLVIAAVPAALRTYQLGSDHASGWVELVVEGLRLVCSSRP